MERLIAARASMAEAAEERRKNGLPCEKNRHLKVFRSQKSGFS
jgi:hypothetical protein